jgi:uncharacterized SAM-binding protein YcdF (DUF218 family)
VALHHQDSSPLHSLRHGISLILAAAVLAALIFCLRQASDALVEVDPIAHQPDVAVLLGGDYQRRAPKAAELFLRGTAPLILVSGRGDCLQNERMLVARGVPISALLVECRARSTDENARLSVQLLHARGVRTAVLVTSLFHTRRALESFRHYAPDIDFYTYADSTGFDPRPHTLIALWQTATELTKTIWHRNIDR